MGKATGFMEFCRQENPLRSTAERLTDFEDLHTALPAPARQEQACRCMNCGVPFCQSDYGCPLHNLIPEWNDLLYHGLEKEAFQRLIKTAPFPEFTGRVCPGLCEKACMLSDDAVTNRDNELYLIEKAFQHGWIEPRPPMKRTGKTVAVIGSGPAGLAAADALNRMGHQVTVYEQADRAGGLLTYGIPNMKLPKEIVGRRLSLMQREGIVFRTSTRADASVMKEYDAVVLCAGSRNARRLNAPGENAEGVHLALDYLTAATKAVLEQRAPAISAENKAVIVVGGGDTGNDCLGTCLRQGCRSVVQLEMLPPPPNQRADTNPWPEWPRILRTDYGQQEAAAIQGKDPRLYETTVQRILTDEAGHINSVEIVNVKNGTVRTLTCDLLLIAAGFVGCELETARDFGFLLTGRGVPDMEHGGRHLKGNLFAAGDMRTGQSLVVRAIADGKAAAEEVNRYLTGC